MIICCEKENTPHIVDKENAQIYINGQEVLILLGNCFNDNYRKSNVEQIYALVKENGRKISDVETLN